MSGKDKGGPEQHARFKQYDYASVSKYDCFTLPQLCWFYPTQLLIQYCNKICFLQNANLVLSADQRSGAGKGPDGTAESLWGKMPGKMGDRVERSKPEGIEEHRTKAKKRRDVTVSDAEFQIAKKRRAGPGSTILDLDTAGFYRPRTKETREAYEALLAVIRSQFGDQPQDILRGAADEVLATLKNEKLRDPDRQKEISELVGEMPNESFARVVALGKLITDFISESDAAAMAADGEGALDEDIGVAVEFEDEDEDDEEEAGLVNVLEDDEDEEEGEGQDLNGAVRAKDEEDYVETDATGQQDTNGMSAQDIDAYWLQRRVAKAFDELEPVQAQKMAEEALAVLQLPDNREIETGLVRLLDFDKFDLIKELARNKDKIVWCTKLARAGSEEERKEIEAEMSSNPQGAAVLDELYATKATARERQTLVARGIKEEARRLRASNTFGADAAAAGMAASASYRKALDLENLVFNEGAHFNASKSCTLPQGSYRTVHKGYEEVHVPALKPKPFADGETLRDVSALPEWAQHGFKGMRSLNRIQSKVCDAALFTSENMLVCAPTGAGKTNVAMLTMLHEIGLHRQSDGLVDTSAFKMVYVAPMKALVAEMVGNFSKRLEPYGVKVRELTGDMSLTRAEIEDTQLIIVTPEKWDIVTRKSGDRAYTQLVKLVIIDEIHLLHDERGPVLECLVARTLRQVEATQEMVRLVGLSATLPNFEDVAACLRVKPDVGLFYFDNSFRPCPLAQQYIGVTTKKPLQRFQLMNEICYNKVIEAAGKHQVLIFVHSRKETAKTAKFIKEEGLKNDTLLKILKDDSASREILQTEAESVKNADLKELLPYGFGIHHAGMTRADRTLVEDLFADGHIQVLVSTATLAWGVNLPAHTVIIKGTQIYNPTKSSWVELSPLDVMQMFGRAGRPQFDTFGEGIIITSHAELQFYLSLFNMQLPVESQFIGTLPDNLNAEIVLGTVQNLKDAATWLGYTYLYVRMLCNPQLYGVPVDAVESDPQLLERRLDLAHSAAVQLDRHNLIKYDRRSGSLQSTDLGRIASHYYVTHSTIATFNEHLKPTMTDIELLRLFALADEFKYMVVREEEKMELAKLLDRVPIPVKESLDDPMAKVNVLMQAYISQLKLEGFALTADMVYVTQSAGRLMRCLYEVCLRRGWSGLAERALNLCKSVARRMWSSQIPLRQFRGVPIDILTRMEKKDLVWDRWYDLSSQELGELIRFPKMGRTLHRLIHQFPRLELAAHVLPLTRSVLKVDLTITPDFQWEDKVHGVAEPFIIWVEDADSELILHHEEFLLRKSEAEEDSLVSFTVPMSDPLPPQYFVRVVSDKWLGCEAILPVSFRHLILPEKYPPPTELLDLQPLPVGALTNPDFEGLYTFSHFNPIQTQVFNALYNSDDNALVAAPAGSGKTACAEFALLRMISKATQGTCTARAVYIAPIDTLATERYADWSGRFGKQLGLNVVSLTGETTVDLKLLERGNIIISTPEKWDSLSRRWKQRKSVQDVSLFLVDEMQLIASGARGAALEVITSRMRYLSSQLSAPIRIVMLGTSIANARDLADWIGASTHSTFNFAPGVRPVPLEISIRGFGIYNLEARMQSMVRPTYASLLHYGAGGAPIVVFVPTRRHARSIALDLLTAAAADREPSRFRMADENDMAPHLKHVKDQALKYCLALGVAFLHETLTLQDAEVAKMMYVSGAAQVLIVSAPMAWSLPSAFAKAVIIMGTQYHDASGRGTSDYPVTDLLQMMGLAGRPGGQDGRGYCVLLCHTPRKEYYKKFLLEPLPVESHFGHFLHDHMAAEIVTRTIQNKQDAVDYLTWTFYYRRLTKNPNYYTMTGVSHRHVSDHLSDLVETVLSDLEASRMISIEDEMDLEPLNLAMIAAYYYTAYTTLELFASSLTARTKLRGLLEILSNATEYDDVLVRPGEEGVVEKLLAHAPLALDTPKYGDPHSKVNALLQAHFSRIPLSPDMAADSSMVLGRSIRLLQAMVDVISSNGWLNPALATMELCQMVTQGIWARDPPLMQCPHISREIAQCIETVFDFIELGDKPRKKMLDGLSDSQIADVARWAERYPDINVAHEVATPADEIIAGEPVSVVVELEREGDEEVGPVYAPRYPGRKDENWWLVVGNQEDNSLLGIKRVALGKRARVKLDFMAPTNPGVATLTLFFMCDSYMGCDQEFELSIDVMAGNNDEIEG